MELAILLTFTAIGAAALMTLPLSRRVFRPIEIAVYFMIFSIFVQQIHVIISFNLDWIVSREDSYIAFWTVAVIRVLIVPSVYFWLAYIWFFPSRRVWAKLLLICGFVVLIFYGGEGLIERLGLQTFVSWKWYYTLIRSGITLGSGILFILYYKSRLKESGVAS